MKYRFRNEANNLSGMAIICLMIAMPFCFLGSCSGKKGFADFEFDSEAFYNVKSSDVIMLISDSGITRFRLETKAWLIFEEAQEPYNYFPEKIHGERLDTLLNVEAVFDADTAYYYYRKKLWKLVNNVKAVNLAGEQFETDLLFWNDAEERIYSDQFIRITKGEFINTGTGFESNRTLSDYRIFNATAEIPFQENTPADSTATEITPQNPE